MPCARAAPSAVVLRMEGSCGPYEAILEAAGFVLARLRWRCAALGPVYVYLLSCMAVRNRVWFCYADTVTLYLLARF